MEKIIIKDAYENNLKHLNLEIPINKFICVTGCSGCGKSSLVFDTEAARQRRPHQQDSTLEGKRTSRNGPRGRLRRGGRPALKMAGQRQVIL